MTLIFKGHVFNQLYVRNGWDDCHKIKTKLIDWMRGIRCELDITDSYQDNFRRWWAVDLSNLNILIGFPDWSGGKQTACQWWIITLLVPQAYHLPEGDGWVGLEAICENEWINNWSILQLGGQIGWAFLISSLWLEYANGCLFNTKPLSKPMRASHPNKRTSMKMNQSKWTSFHWRNPTQSYHPQFYKHFVQGRWVKHTWHCRKPRILLQKCGGERGV